MKKILILSGKGGTGKTTVASAFIHFSKTKYFADCDVDAPNLHLVEKFDVSPQKSNYYGSKRAFIDPNRCDGCGLCAKSCRFEAIQKIETRRGEKDFKRYFVDEYECEGCGLCEYLCPQKAINLQDDVAGFLELYKSDRVFSTAQLKMGRGNSGKLVTAVKAALDKNLEEREPAKRDLIIIDGSPGIGCPVIASISGADLALIVAEPSLSGISDMKRIIKTAEIFETQTAVCINKFDVNLENSKKIENFCLENQIFFAGSVPYDKKVSEFVNRGGSIAETDLPVSAALLEVFNKVVNFLNF